jgi:hypothetical protein
MAGIFKGANVQDPNAQFKAANGKVIDVKALHPDTVCALAAAMGGTAIHKFFVAPNGYAGATPPNHTLVAADGTGHAAVQLIAGYNVVRVAFGAQATPSLTLTKPATGVYEFDLVDDDGSLNLITPVYA